MIIADMTIIMIKDYEKYYRGNYYSVKKTFGRFLVNKGYAIDRFSPNFEKQMADIRRAEERERNLYRSGCSRLYGRFAERRHRELHPRSLQRA